MRQRPRVPSDRPPAASRASSAAGARARRALLVAGLVALAVWWLARPRPPVPDEGGARSLARSEEPGGVPTGTGPEQRDAPASRVPAEEESAPAPPRAGVDGGGGASAEHGGAPRASSGGPGTVSETPEEGGRRARSEEDDADGSTSSGSTSTETTSSGSTFGEDPRTTPGSTGSGERESDAGSEPTVLVTTRYEVDFTGGERDWQPRNARVTPARTGGAAALPGTPATPGYLVEPWDTRRPDQRELNLPLGLPRLVCDSLAWEAERVDELVVRAAFVEDGTARVYFRATVGGSPGDAAEEGASPEALEGPDEGGFDERDFVEIEVRGGEGLGDWSFPVADHPRWGGEVTGLRLDLVQRRVPFLVAGVRARERLRLGGDAR